MFKTIQTNFYLFRFVSVVLNGNEEKGQQKHLKFWVLQWSTSSGKNGS
jgi:hypothetical protein